MKRVCMELTGDEDPSSLPDDATVLLKGMQTVAGGWTAQMRRKGLVFMRAMLGEIPSLARVVRAFPVRLRSVADPVQRQRQLVQEDVVPKALRGTWKAEILNKVLQNPISAAWRTSKSARQTLSMIHHMLRCMNLLQCEDFETFEMNLKQLAAEDVQKLCGEFCDTLCHGVKSARQYSRVQNIVFHHVWRLLPQPIKHSRQRRRMRTLAELDDALSEASNANRNTKDKDILFLTEEQCQSLINACGNCVRHLLIVKLLLTTGLRRQGLVNIRITDVAAWDETKQVWDIDNGGRTLEKGGKRRTFPLYPEVQELIDQWLNGKCPQSRPCSPSKYLFPSSTTNNGQMSPETLRHVFRSLCRRANIPKHLSHLHVMRHSCAHRLLEAGNSSRQIAAYLGHASSATTERFYLRDSTENITKDMATPAPWRRDAPTTGLPTNLEPKRTSTLPTEPPPAKKRRPNPKIDVLQQALALREERNRALRLEDAMP